MRLVLVLVAGVVLVAACGGSSSSPTTPSATTYVITSSELTDMLSEKVMGNAAATVTIVEYSSLTCPHCASFHASTLPQLKSAYLDTGKVKLIYRDFPVPGASTATAAYAAAALARCAGSARYFEAVDLLYRTQSSWTGAANPITAMKQAAAPLGIDAGKVDACIANADVQNEINRLMSDARTAYGVGGTPTFIVNGQKIVGSVSFLELDAILKTVVP